MKNCSFKSKTGQIKYFVEIEDGKRIFKSFFTNNEKGELKILFYLIAPAYAKKLVLD